jgi:RNA polymerase sigma-70 factor (ECF subfamily)
MTASTAALASAFDSERRFLWGLGYRLTGCAADADDLVQETFVRAMQRPPERMDEPLRPWLVRVALNLGRGLLRRRRRRGYAGPWLPSPIETAEEEPPAHEPSDPRLDVEGSYELMESVSFAFLLALEALTPTQRAVLLLRDVFDYTVREASEALDMTEPNVKTTHHRARRAMRDYDRRRSFPTRERQARTRAALESFLAGLIERDVGAIEKVLAADVRSIHDGGGEYVAARRPVIGRDKVTRLYLGLAPLRTLASIEVRMLNGLPAFVIEFADRHPRQADRVVTRCEVDDEGRISAIHTILASRKLTAVRRACRPVSR